MLLLLWWLAGRPPGNASTEPAASRTETERADPPDLLGRRAAPPRADAVASMPAPTPRPSAFRWVRVVDAREDTPLSGFPVLVAGEAVTTDGAGRVLLPAGAGVRLPEDAASHWRVAAGTTHDGEGEPLLYLLPLVSVEVTVTYNGFTSSDAGRTRGRLRASVAWDPIREPVMPQIPRTRLDWQKMRRVSLDSTDLTDVEPDERGVARARVHVPALAGFTLTIETHGWLQAWTPLGLPKDGDTFQLEVRRSPTLEGKLVAEDGRPLKGVTIQAHFFMVGHQDALPLKSAFTRVDTGGGITSSFDRRTGQGGFSYDQEVTTAEDGSFAFNAPLSGMDVQFLALPADRRAAVAVRTDVRKDLDGIELRTPRASPEAPRPRIELRGQPLVSTSVAITDVTIPHAQSMYRVTTDGEGRVESNWFLPKRAYLARSGSPELGDGLAGVFVWDGRAVIRGEDLIPYPDWLEQRQASK